VYGDDNCFQKYKEGKAIVSITYPRNQKMKSIDIRYRDFEWISFSDVHFGPNQ